MPSFARSSVPSSPANMPKHSRYSASISASGPTSSASTEKSSGATPHTSHTAQLGRTERHTKHHERVPSTQLPAMLPKSPSLPSWKTWKSVSPGGSTVGSTISELQLNISHRWVLRKPGRLFCRAVASCAARYARGGCPRAFPKLLVSYRTLAHDSWRRRFSPSLRRLSDKGQA